MQFVINGPDIPDALLQAHEEGRVVFFCGAGISRPAGLPDFRGLVQTLFQRAGEPSDKTESDLIEQNQYDRAIGHYERRIQGGRAITRRALPSILSGNLAKRRALTTHMALLTIGRSRGGGLKLVTTNFDTLFEAAVRQYGLPSPTIYHDPPTRLRWDGVVHLHGRMPAEPSVDELDQLILSDGDFGQAYLTQGWAARFVAGLFRDCTLCFVGYSIDDPVLRYMTAAHALDGAQKMFAFAPYETGEAEQALQAWKNKHVTPILYDDASSHRSLHQTLHVWASVYRDGILGKERLIARYAHRQPKESKSQNDFVSRVLWALSDRSGLPAKRFADFSPSPSLGWLLDALSDERYRHSDLVRFGVPAREKIDGNLRFSLIRRPAPYNLAQPIQLVSGGVSDSQWDPVMIHLSRWLVRQLGDPRLIIWLAERGGQLHDDLSWRIQHELDRFAVLERDGKFSELDEIRSQAPKAIPGPRMRVLWQLLLSGRVKLPWRRTDLYQWASRLRGEGLNIMLRLELRELLAPKVRLTKPFHGDQDDSDTEGPTQIETLVNQELVLTTDDVHSALSDLGDEHWKSALPRLLEDFQQLLRDALDILSELGEADDHRDRSYWDLPSISAHWQNRGFRDWVSLIELLRDAWLAVHANDRVRATRIAKSWFDLPYPTFKRLALFAASQDACISPEQWVDWLLTDDARWLWATDSRREMFRLLVLQGGLLSGAAQIRLEAAILVGPPREMYRDDLEADRWQRILTQSVWLRLAKLETSGCALGALAAARLAEISTAYPQLQLATNERDEFSHWMSGTGDPDYEDIRDVDIAPRTRQGLVEWLAKPLPERRPFYEDTWRDVCRTRFFHSLLALRDLDRTGVWPTARWREALQVWAEEGMLFRSWRYAAPLVQTLPDDQLQELAHGVTWWMEAAAKSIDCHEHLLLDLCQRVLALPLEAGPGSRIIGGNGAETDDPVGAALDHPIGHVTKALINFWFKRDPNDNDLLPAEIKPTLTSLCDVQIDRFRHGRVMLGLHLIAFFRVDRSWTEQYLLPLFNWSHPIEARAMWQGFLQSPRLHQPLMIAFKPQFLESANHYADLGEHRQQFAAFLTNAALGLMEGYTLDDFRLSVGEVPHEGLEASAQALYQALEGAADQREDYWRRRAHPFWLKVWPKSREVATPRIARSLARLAIAAGGEFPAALAAVQDWLQPIEYLYEVLHPLHKSGLCLRFPAEALSLLDAVIADQREMPRELGLCLDEIVQAAPSLERDARYLRLREYSRRRGV